MSIAGTIGPRTLIVGINHPENQVSANVWNDSRLVTSIAPDGAVFVKDSAQPDGWGLLTILPSSAVDLSTTVLNTRTVNGHALSSDVTVTKSDVGLSAVENTALSTWAGSTNITTIGPSTITRNNLVLTSTDGLVIQNTTPSIFGGINVQISPRLRLSGTVDDGTGESYTVSMYQEVIPSSSLTPGATWKLGFYRVGSIAPGAATAMTVTSGGIVTSGLFVGTGFTTTGWTTTGRLVAGGVLPPNGVDLYVSSQSGADPRGMMSAQYSSDTVGARIHLRKARFSEASPAVIVTGDLLGRIRFSGYDGTNYLQMGSIDVVSTGTIATNRVPTYMTFSAATDAAPSVLIEVLRLTETGLTTTKGVACSTVTCSSGGSLFNGGLYLGTGGVNQVRFLPWAVDQLIINNIAGTGGIGIDVGTDAVMKIRNRFHSVYATVDALGYSVGGVAGASKAAGPVTSITVVNGIVTAIS